MKKYRLLAALTLCMAGSAAAAGLTVPTLSLEQANRLADAAIAACQARGYPVSVTVVDRSGVTLASQRMDNAGPHTVQASFRKAWTALSTKTASGKVMESAQKNPGAQHMSDIPGFLLLAGGLPVKVDSKVIGAIGIGGAPGGQLDESCAQEALDKTR
ncbi:uncharacterized protein GlcG (DUF336 family) [Raoultella sp. BIGb0138]|uniref:GlcG/HbpS family heme-binding protein n=1 Tax=Raoultella sp. BIGb0138 TaxID=2485115 RepID=UPI001049FDDB|nr:heme-binding protein [Raoultella sp. BIGb0138]TCW15292.1 uncharacterized protein GlcG (DUF336 family) [Raoultella sp. BIGb0138]